MPGHSFSRLFVVVLAPILPATATEVRQLDPAQRELAAHGVEPLLELLETADEVDDDGTSVIRDEAVLETRVPGDLELDVFGVAGHPGDTLVVAVRRRSQDARVHRDHPRVRIPHEGELVVLVEHRRGPAPLEVQGRVVGPEPHLHRIAL